MTTLSLTPAVIWTGGTYPGATTFPGATLFPSAHGITLASATTGALTLAAAATGALTLTPAS